MQVRLIENSKRRAKKIRWGIPYRTVPPCDKEIKFGYEDRSSTTAVKKLNPFRARRARTTRQGHKRKESSQGLNNAMSAKRQKISHPSGSRPGSEPGPSRSNNDPSPPSSESATLDETPTQESGEVAPATFKDLVSSVEKGDFCV